MDTITKPESVIHPALTSFSEEEQMFREAVRDFDTSEIAPLVSQMDQRQEVDPGLLPQLFELGLMGI
jgi:alkylation response protein AidB-like acyl-CoA dehydrogenase